MRRAEMGKWSCEATLWTHWAHCGSLRARTECTLVVLDAAKFQNIATQFQNQVPFAQRYGEKFVSYCNEVEQDQLTDLEDPEMGIEWLTNRACALGETQEKRRSKAFS